MNLALALAILLQEPPKPDPTSGGVNEVRVTQAIERGIKYLRGAGSPDLHGAYGNSDELILWTFIHAGVPSTDPQFQQLFKSVTTATLKRTYKVSLLAMILEELDRVKYQDKIAQCAQFLVDNQCTSGLWGYGNESLAVKEFPVDLPAPAVVTPGAKPAAKPKAPKKVSIKKTRDGADPGDNSNSQYAALGLRACHDAGIDIPDATITAAIKAWKDAQFTEADRNKGKDGKGAVASSGRRVEGWNYKTAALDPRAPYHAMTAGAVGALVIYAYIQKRSWKNDATITTGMNWLVDKWEMQAWNAYYMYALERFGILYGTETIGTHHWYREGAYAILGIQQSDGSWSKDEEGVGGSMWYGKTWDTCFSILFLRRATKPLVATSVMK